MHKMLLNFKQPELWVEVMINNYRELLHACIAS